MSRSVWICACIASVAQAAVVSNAKQSKYSANPFDGKSNSVKTVFYNKGFSNRLRVSKRSKSVVLKNEHKLGQALNPELATYYNFMLSGPLWMGSSVDARTMILYDTTQSWTAMETVDTADCDDGFEYSEPSYRAIDVEDSEVSIRAYYG